MTDKPARDDHGVGSFVPVGPGTPSSDSGPAGHWRWRSYTDHLDDLGYEMNGASAAGPAADELAQAVAEYRRRSRPSG